MSTNSKTFALISHKFHFMFIKNYFSSSSSIFLHFIRRPARASPFGGGKTFPLSKRNSCLNSSLLIAYCRSSQTFVSRATQPVRRKIFFFFFPFIFAAAAFTKTFYDFFLFSDAKAHIFTHNPWCLLSKVIRSSGTRCLYHFNFSSVRSPLGWSTRRKMKGILETQIVTFFPYRISLLSLSFTFRCFYLFWRRFLPSEYCDNDFYVLTASSRQQRQQSYFTLQGDWSVNCDVCGCSGNCVFSLLMSASRNTKAKENIFPFVYETKNRFFIRNITLWGFSRHPLATFVV